MTRELIGMIQDALLLALLLAGPALVGALVAGVVMTLIGAVTQVDDVSVALVPRVAGVALGLAVASPWIAAQAAAFAERALAVIPALGAPGG